MPRSRAGPDLEHALEDRDVDPDAELATDLLLHAHEAETAVEVQAQRGLVRGDHVGNAGMESELGGHLHQAPEQHAPHPTTPELLGNIDRVLDRR
jgi:hypothetical protein